MDDDIRDAARDLAAAFQRLDHGGAITGLIDNDDRATGYWLHLARRAAERVLAERAAKLLARAEKPQENDGAEPAHTCPLRDTPCGADQQMWCADCPLRRPEHYAQQEPRR